MFEAQKERQSQIFQYARIDQDIFADEDRIDDNKNFILIVVGITFNVYSLWRFPYLLCKYGSSFLIPYAIFYILVLFPFLYLEVAVYQYYKRDFLSFWLRTCPLFKGLGYCSMFLSFSFTLFLSVSVLYLGGMAVYYYNYRFALVGCFIDMHEISTPDICNYFNNSKQLIPQFEFLNFDAAKITINLRDSLTKDTLQIMFCLIIFILYILFSSIRKLKYLAEIVWVLVVMPTIYFTGLMIFFGCQTGSEMGFYHCFRFNSLALYESEIWVDASLQIILTSGCGLGSISTIAAHQYFYSNPLKNCKIICYFILARTAATCLLCVFYLGYVMYKYETEAIDLLQDGYGWIISISSIVRSILPSPIMEVNGFIYYCMNIMMLFFNIIINLRAFSWMIQKNFFHNFIDRDWKRIVFTVLLLIMVFSISKIFQLEKTLYIFTLVHITCCYLLLWQLFLKSIVLSWIYGVDEIELNIKRMIGRKPNFYFRFCWRFAIPIILLFTIYGYEKSYVNHPQITAFTSFGYWVIVVPVRTIFFYFPIVLILLCAIKAIRATEGNRYYMKLAYAISPVQDHYIIGKYRTCKRLKARHWLHL